MTSAEQAALAGLDATDRQHRERSERLAARLEAIAARVSELRRVADSNALLDRACADAAECAGFARTMISQVTGSCWLPWMVHSRHDPALAEEFARRLQGVELPLTDGTPEHIAVGERRPVRADDAAVVSPLPALLAGRTTSYVVVPLIASGRVMGLLHGDQSRAVQGPDAVDRDALWAFGEAFALVYERAVLAGRIRAQRERLREAFAVAEHAAEAIATAELRLLPDGTEDGPRVRGAVEASDLAGRLSAREQEVAALMARGLGNAAIAAELVIAPTTVKTHVKSIVRKLGAVNRAEAVARYLGHARR